MSKDKKALVKETGEIQEVKSEYQVAYITATFNFDLSDEQSDEIKKMTFVHDSESQKEGTHYTLSNGKTYHEKDVVVGLDNIRDEKLKNII
jgi:choline kinase